MSYIALIDRESKRAFTLLKDLKRIVSVTKNSTPTDFDFSSADVAQTTTTVTAQIMFTSKAKVNKEEAKTASAIMLVKEVGELAINDVIVDGSDTWLVKGIPFTGEFTLQLQLERKQA